jgi:hypothetical protein
MAVGRRDNGDTPDDSAARLASQEDHRWLTDTEDEPEPRRPALKVGRVRLRKVRAVRGATRRR